MMINHHHSALHLAMRHATTPHLLLFLGLHNHPTVRYLIMWFLLFFFFFLRLLTIWFWLLFRVSCAFMDVVYNEAISLWIPEAFLPFIAPSPVSHPPSAPSCFTLHSHFLSLGARPKPSTFSSSSARPSIKSWIYYVKQNRAMTLCPCPSMSLVENE